MEEVANVQTRIIERDLEKLSDRFDRHLEIYASNGKELAGLKIAVSTLDNSIGKIISKEDINSSRISSLEVDVAKIAVRSGIYASIFSAFSSGIVVLFIERVFS